MTHEDRIRASVDRRLSGLTASPARRARIRAAVADERKSTMSVKRKLTAALAFALIAAMLMTVLAFAERLNLFDFFGAQEPRYAALAPAATLEIAEPARIAHEHLGSVAASIDSAYFDGLTLQLAYRIENALYAEAYTPTAEELAAMQPVEPAILALAGGESFADVYEAYNEAVRTGIPFGYRQYHVYASDHVLTDDGVDIPPATAMEDLDESGAYCHLLDFASPLPAALTARDTLQVSIALHQQETIVWFDGSSSYRSYDRSDVGTMTAVIPRTEDSVRTLTGTGTLNGATVTASALVSPMAASVTITADAPFDTFLGTPPEGIDPFDTWVEITLRDEQGRSLRATEGPPLDGRTAVVIPFDGTGSLPETLALRMYAQWEGVGVPEPEAFILLTGQ